MRNLKRNLARLALACFLAQVCTANAFSISCALGKTCIQTQGTKLDPDTVIELMRYCDDFTRNGIGAQMLRMSLQQIHARSNGRPGHPLQLAQYAFEKIHESPLQFQRKKAAEETNYLEIQASCGRLYADFNDKSKWNK